MHAETYSASVDDLAAREELAKPIADRIELALYKLASDPGAIFERDVLADLIEVRQTDPARYQRVRAAAKAGKAGVGELDKLTMAKDDGGNIELFENVEPWAHPVDGAQLLADLCAIIGQHVIADPPTIRAAALWIVHTYCMEELTVSPLAHISAPEMRCGKTVLLTAMMRLVYRPLSVSSITPSAIFRSVELWSPTLGIDEADAFLKDNEEARGLINSGLYRDGASVIRCVGDDHMPTKFSTWAPKILCGIGKLAGTIEDRSIPLRMRRKVAGETAANIRRSDPQPWADLKSRLTRWTGDHQHRIASARPTPAHGLGDRAQDCWEPMLSIADLAGGDWPGLARAAALALHGVEEETPSIGAELLRDVKEVFDRRTTSRLASAVLIEELTKDDELPWSTWNRGRPISPRQLSARLGEFGIRSKNLKMANGSVPKGYDLADFHDAILRYLSPASPNLSATTLQPHGNAVSGEFACATTHLAVAASNGSQTAIPSQSSVVADKTVDPVDKEGASSKTGMEVIDI